ncbi:MAG: hypothetical protein ACRDNR_17310, partial [Gaiellaceae bacterium]
MDIGEDHDQFVRTENGWRIFARRWVSSFERRTRCSSPTELRPGRLARLVLVVPAEPVLELSFLMTPARRAVEQ